MAVGAASCEELIACVCGADSHRAVRDDGANPVHFEHASERGDGNRKIRGRISDIHHSARHLSAAPHEKRRIGVAVCPEMQSAASRGKACAVRHIGPYRRNFVLVHVEGRRRDSRTIPGEEQRPELIDLSDEASSILDRHDAVVVERSVIARDCGPINFKTMGESQRGITTPEGMRRIRAAKRQQMPFSVIEIPLCPDREPIHALHDGAVRHNELVAVRICVFRTLDIKSGIRLLVAEHRAGTRHVQAVRRSGEALVPGEPDVCRHERAIGDDHLVPISLTGEGRGTHVRPEVHVISIKCRADPCHSQHIAMPDVIASCASIGPQEICPQLQGSIRERNPNVG